MVRVSHLIMYQIRIRSVFELAVIVSFLSVIKTHSLATYREHLF